MGKKNKKPEYMTLISSEFAARENGSLKGTVPNGKGGRREVEFTLKLGPGTDPSCFIGGDNELCWQGKEADFEHIGAARKPEKPQRNSFVI